MRTKSLKPGTVNEAARPTLDHFAALNKRTQAKRNDAIEPEVGVFFIYDGKLLIDGTPVSEAEPYGSFKGHAAGHPSFWQTLQRNGLVSSEVEYDEVARGRVGYDMKERKFYVFVDACIKKNARMIDRIQRDMNLPSQQTAPPRLDPHYRCPDCIKSKKQRQQEEADWDF